MEPSPPPAHPPMPPSQTKPASQKTDRDSENIVKGIIHKGSGVAKLNGNSVCYHVTYLYRQIH